MKKHNIGIHSLVFGTWIAVGIVMYGITNQALLSFLMSSVACGISASTAYPEIYVPWVRKKKENLKEQEEHIHLELQTNTNNKTHFQSIWNDSQQQMWRAIFNDVTFNSEINRIISTVDYILQRCSLSEEERQYLIQDFPNEFSAVLLDYRQLRGEHQERMKKRIQDFVASKLTEWENIYIHPVQDVLEENCIQKLEKVSQIKKEKIYITE